MSAEGIKLLHEKMDLIKEQVQTLRAALASTDSPADNPSIDDLDSKNNCLSILSELAYSFQEMDQVFDSCVFMGPSRIADLKTQTEYCLNVVRNLSMETISPAPIILEGWFRNIDLMDEILARIAEIVVAGGDEDAKLQSAGESPEHLVEKERPGKDDAQIPLNDHEGPATSDLSENAEAVQNNNPNAASAEPDPKEELIKPKADGGDFPAGEKSSVESNEQIIGGQETKISPGSPLTPPIRDEDKRSSAEIYAARFARFGPISYDQTKKPQDLPEKKSPTEEDGSKRSIGQPDGGAQDVKVPKPSELPPIQHAGGEQDSAVGLKTPSQPEAPEIAGQSAASAEAGAVPPAPKGDASVPDSVADGTRRDPADSKGGEGGVHPVKDPPLSQKDEQAIEETVKKANEFIGVPADSSEDCVAPPEKSKITVTDRLSLIHEALEKLISVRTAEMAEEMKCREETIRSADRESEEKREEETKIAEQEAFLEAIRKQEDVRREEFSHNLMKEVTSLHAELTGKIKDLESQIGHLSDKEQQVEAKLEAQYREQIDGLEHRLQRLKDEMASEKLKGGNIDERKVLEIIEEREHAHRLPVAAPAAAEVPVTADVEQPSAPEPEAHVSNVSSEIPTERTRSEVSVWSIVFRAVRFFILSFLVAVCVVGGSWFVLERVLLNGSKITSPAVDKTGTVESSERKSSAAFTAFEDSRPVSLEKRSLRLIVLQLRDNPRPYGRVQMANMLRGFRWKGVPEVLLETAKNDPDPRVAAEAFASFKDMTQYPGIADSNYAAVEIWWAKNKAEINAKLEDAD